MKIPAILPNLAYRRTVIELLHVAGGLIVAVMMTWAAAWSYPLGWDVIWWCGIAAMIATVGMGVRPLRQAWKQDTL